jgi:hypothetical protein
MPKDIGVSPDYMDRHFRQSEAQVNDQSLDWRTRISKEAARKAVAAREATQTTRERDLAALAALQARRPLKPPGRR